MEYLISLVTLLSVVVSGEALVSVPPLVDRGPMTQASVNQVVNIYKKNSTLKSKALAASNSDLINTGFYLVNGKSEFWDRDDRVEEQPIMMASVSKLATTVYGISKAGDEVGIDAGIIRELLFREASRINTKKEIYHPLLKNKYRLSPAEINSLATLSSGYTSALNKIYALDGKVKATLPVKELLYHDLTLSSNTAADKFKFIGIGKDDPRRALEKMNTLLLTPSYELTITISKLMHWRQSAANTGKISEHAYLLSRLADLYSIDKLPDEYSLVLSSIINNKSDFGFDFTNSSLGKSLQKKGWKVLEKTGYYPVVFWISDLANGKLSKLPPHMTLSTIVSLIPPKDSKIVQPITFSYYMNIEVLAPTTNVRERSTGLLVPNDYAVGVDPGYFSYLEGVKKKANRDFRGKLISKISPLVED